MISTSRIRLTIASLLVLTLILVWQFGWRVDSTGPTFTDKEQRIDWFVNDALLTRWEIDGSRSSVTDAERITHFEGRAESELTRPYSVGFNSSQEVSRILSSLHATVQDDSSRIDLAEQVELHHNPETDQAVAMFTPSLTLFPDRELAVTADPVEITSSSGETRAVGMEFYAAENRMELLSKVRGNYVATENR